MISNNLSQYAGTMYTGQANYMKFYLFHYEQFSLKHGCLSFLFGERFRVVMVTFQLVDDSIAASCKEQLLQCCVSSQGGFSNFDWSGMCRWQLGTHTHVQGYFLQKKGTHV